MVWTGRLLSVLRIVGAFLFIAHGTQKLWGVPGGNPVDDLLTLRGIAGILEVFGGALVLVGWLTRPVAFILSGEMAVAYFLRHEPRGFWPILNGGELAALYCFLYLYLAAAGGGSWSVDTWVTHRRARRRGR